MDSFSRNSQFFHAILIISLAGFLVLPHVCLSEEINIKNLDNYLTLPEGKIRNSIDSLINLFHSEWIDRESSGYYTDQESTIPGIMREVVRVEAMSHLLIDAPIEIIGNIIKAAVELTNIYFHPSLVLETIERFTVEKAIDEGIKQLFKDEIRVLPGAITFRYQLRKGGVRDVNIQYIVIHKPVDEKMGEMVMKFYSPLPLFPPKNEGSVGVMRGSYYGGEGDIPPFTVEVKGQTEDYVWVGKPTIRINIKDPVPDLGIKPLNFWEERVLKPIATSIKNVEVLITRFTGFEVKISDKINNIPVIVKNILELIQSKILGIFSPASLSDDIKEIVSEPDIIEQEQAPSLGKSQEVAEQDVIEPELEEKTEIKQEENKIVLEENLKENDAKKETVVFCEKEGIPVNDQVIFNEIAWMGGVKSASDEWMELKNLTGSPINLAGWQLLDKKNQIKIVFTDKNIIPANGLILLERTDDNSVPYVSADLIYTGEINNYEESLYLFDKDCRLKDKAETFAEWELGDNDSKRTMERKKDLTWQTGADISGTPRMFNSQGYPSYKDQQFAGGEVGDITVLPAVAESTLILISEVQVDHASSSEYDFIELYNFSTGTVDVSNFQLKKRNSAGTESSISVFPDNISIPASGYLIWTNSGYASSGAISADITTSQTLASNNSVVLLDRNRNIIDSVAWGTSTNPFIETSPFNQNPEENQSLGRRWSSSTPNYTDTNDNSLDFELQTPTPGARNQALEENPVPVQQQEDPLLSVVVNEIAWMGTKADSSDEWMELYNNTQANIDLTNWTIHWSHGTTTISTSTGSTEILSHGFYLLERTNDQVISDIQANQIFTGALSNDGERIELRNASGTLMDLIDFSGGWIYGSSSPNYISMERITSSTTGATSTNWASNNRISVNGTDADGHTINGTPRATNSVSKTQTEIAWAIDYPTLTYLGSPYIITGNLTIANGATVNIEPGVVLKFNENVGLEVKGTLRAIGEDGNKITFTSISSDKRWKYINFSSSSSNSVLENCLIENLSYGDSNYAINIDYTSVTLKDSDIENTATAVIRLNNSTTTINNLTINRNTTGFAIEILGGAPEVKNSRIVNAYAGIAVKNGSRAILSNNYLEGTSYPLGPIYSVSSFPRIEGNTSASNTFNGITLQGTVTENWHLYKNEGLPYYSSLSQIAENTTLELSPGSTFNNKRILEIKGTFKADAGGGERITFSCSGADCYTGELYFLSQSINSVFNNTFFEKGHSNGIIWASSSNISFQNTEFSESNTGIVLENSSSTISNCVFSNISSQALKINDGAPLVENSNFSTGNLAIYIEGGAPSINNNHFEGFIYPLGVIYGKDTSSIFSGNTGQNNLSNKIAVWDTINNIWTYINL